MNGLGNAAGVMMMDADRVKLWIGMDTRSTSLSSLSLSSRLRLALLSCSRSAVLLPFVGPPLAIVAVSTSTRQICVVFDAS